MEKIFIINGTLYHGESVQSIYETDPGDEIIVNDGTVFVLKPKIDDQTDSFREREQLEYDAQLDGHLIEDINYDEKTIRQMNDGDLEQLAADSFFQGWEAAKQFLRNQGHQIP